MIGELTETVSAYNKNILEQDLSLNNDQLFMLKQPEFYKYCKFIQLRLSICLSILLSFRSIF